MQKNWFKAKNYGWGWRPVTWQGWVVTLGFMVLILFNSLKIDATVPATGNAIKTILLQNLVYVIILIMICYITGERPEWRWRGKPIKLPIKTNKVIAKKNN